MNGPSEREEPAETIVVRALAQERGSDARWEHVMALHRRDDEASLRVLLGLLRHAEDETRGLAADALGQFATDRDRPGAVARPFVAEIVDALIAAAVEERDPGVIGSIAVALGHLGDARAVPVLAGWCGHADGGVREDVAFGLCGFDSEAAVDALLELTTDPVAVVRDWATFGLGVQTDHDTPRIRAALCARLEDADPQVIAEALHGLAMRGDASIVPAILRERSLDDPAAGWNTLTDAAVVLAARTADPQLCAIVVEERARWLAERPGETMYGTLQEAIVACNVPE